MTKHIVEVAIADIVERVELMPRKGVSDAVVMDYKASLELLPPILLGVDKNSETEVLVLLDGWHRLTAHREEGHETIKAVIDRSIKPEDFRAVAARANKAHGRRLTAEEKRTVARKLYLEEERDTDFIADVIGCSDRHARRLVESFERVKKDLMMKQAYTMSKKKNKETGKPYTVREIAGELTSDTFPVSKSAASRWIQKMKRQADAEPESAHADVEEIDYGDDEEVADETPDVVLPKKDKQSAKEFLSKLGEIAQSVSAVDKKMKGLTYSRGTVKRIETSVEILRKAIDSLTNSILDLDEAL